MKKPIKGDIALPLERERQLTAATPRLRRWGNRLKQALVMSDAEYEAVSQAIDEGIALTDPAFPKVTPLQLDPTADAKLIEAIAGKGRRWSSLHRWVNGLRNLHG